MQNVVAHQRKKLPIFARIESITKHGDRVWTGLNIGMSLVVVLLMLLVGILLWQDSASSRQAFGFSFLSPFTEAAWNPVENNFAAWPFIYGTFITSLVALIIAVPLSIGIAIFLSELCPPWLRTPLNLLVELLSAIPSVVYGLWGIFVFLPLVITPLGQFLGSTLGSVPLLGSLFSGPISASGSSRLAAGVILAIMILPTIAAVTAMCCWPFLLHSVKPHLRWEPPAGRPSRGCSCLTGSRASWGRSFSAWGARLVKPWL